MTRVVTCCDSITAGAETASPTTPWARPLNETRPDDTVRHMEWDARGFLCALEERPPAADGRIARRVQQFSYDDSGLLIGRTPSGAATSAT